METHKNCEQNSNTRFTENYSIHTRSVSNKISSHFLSNVGEC